jgi:hypothetical protein
MRLPGANVGSAAAAALMLAAGAALLVAQRPDAFAASIDDAAIQYRARDPQDRIARLNLDLRNRHARLTFDAAGGYLPSLLAAVEVPRESQVLVFSQTSAQFEQINLHNPRAVFFNDDVAVGWVRGAEVLEVTAHDPQQGVVFYTLAQKASEVPQFTRDNSCLLCHQSWDTYAVPGLQVLTTFPMSDDKNAYAAGGVADHRTPFGERWGGWYVTGKAVPPQHLGNLPVVRPDNPPPRPAPVLASVEGQFEATGYPSKYSDVVALMVLDHQTRMTNLLTWVGWEARVAPSRSAAVGAQGGPAAASERVLHAASELVDYMMFVDEAPLPRPVAGSSGFAEWFAAKGPRDSKGRSLRQFDLTDRLLRYRCSFLIYSPAFDALPPVAKDAVYRRLWAILSGSENGRPYDLLRRDNRQAIVEILRETKADLPEYFQTVTR